MNDPTASRAAAVREAAGNLRSAQAEAKTARTALRELVNLAYTEGATEEKLAELTGMSRTAIRDALGKRQRYKTQA